MQYAREKPCETFNIGVKACHVCDDPKEVLWNERLVQPVFGIGNVALQKFLVTCRKHFEMRCLQDHFGPLQVQFQVSGPGVGIAEAYGVLPMNAVLDDGIADGFYAIVVSFEACAKCYPLVMDWG